MTTKARKLADLGNQIDDGAITGTNMVINGGMTVAQRGVSFSASNGQDRYGADRFFARLNDVDQATITVSQETDAPSGFVYSLKVNTDVAETALAADEQYKLEHRVEGNSISQLAWGTADAKTVTISFWFKSSTTGTTAVALVNSPNDRSYIASFTVDAANTWEYKTLTIAGPTDGTWKTDNTTGIRLRWGTYGTDYENTPNQWNNSQDMMVAGGIDYTDTVDKYFQITGVCLNVGDSAIDFPHESYGDTLAKCQRYYCTAKRGNYRPLGSFRNGYGEASDFPVPMRATPTASSNSGSVSIRTHTAYNASAVVTASVYAVPINQTSWSIAQNAFTTNGQLVWCYTQGWEPILMFDAEL